MPDDETQVLADKIKKAFDLFIAAKVNKPIILALDKDGGIRTLTNLVNSYMFFGRDIPTEVLERVNNVLDKADPRPDFFEDSLRAITDLLEIMENVDDDRWQKDLEQTNQTLTNLINDVVSEAFPPLDQDTLPDGKPIPVPNPSSEAAIKLGCTCPQLDNNYGRGSSTPGPNGKPTFWIETGCPVHDPR